MPSLSRLGGNIYKQLWLLGESIRVVVNAYALGHRNISKHGTAQQHSTGPSGLFPC